MYSYRVTELQGRQRDIANPNADSPEADAANKNAEIVEVLNDMRGSTSWRVYLYH